MNSRMSHAGETVKAQGLARRIGAMRMRILGCGMACLAGCGMVAAAGLAEHLPANRCAIGRPASDRAWWGVWAKSPEAAIAIKRAETCLKTPMPPFDAISLSPTRHWPTER